jgi:hypothetical protein
MVHFFINNYFIDCHLKKLMESIFFFALFLTTVATFKMLFLKLINDSEVKLYSILD